MMTATRSDLRVQLQNEMPHASCALPNTAIQRTVRLLRLRCYIIFRATALAFMYTA